MEPYLFGSLLFPLFILIQTDVFWGTLARSRLRWIRDFERVSECDMTTGQFRWFINGQINVSGKF